MSTKERLIRCFEVNGIDINCSDPDDLYDLSSLEFISVLVEIENEFAVEFPDYLLKYETLSDINKLCEIIEALANEEI